MRAFESDRRGFTLAELLGAIAVMVILLALTIPAVAAIQSSLRMMRLDAQAKEIYNAAQYRLTSIHSVGGADADALVAGGNFRPADYVWDVEDGDPSIYATVKGEPAATDYLLPRKATGATATAMAGQFAIEYNPVTGEVYSVFYWENTGNDAAKAVASARPTDARAYYEAVRGDRTKPTRARERVGYYCGAQVGKIINGEERAITPTVRAELVNSEELYVRISTEGGNAEGMANLRVKVEVQELENNKTGQNRSWTWTTTGARLEDCLIDSIDGGYVPGREGGLTHGLNIRVRVTADTGEGTDQLLNFEATTNSAFASYDSQSKRYEVSCLRHLYNIGQADPNVWDPRFEQIANIDFDGTHWADDSVSIQTLKARGRKNNPDADLNPLREGMAPLKPSREFSNATTILTSTRTGGVDTDVEGADEDSYYQLRNFKIVGTGDNQDNVGLFSSVNMSFEHLRIANAEVAGRNNVGALVGYHNSAGGHITDCHVIDSLVTGTGDNVGGLVGDFRSASMQGCKALSTVAEGEDPDAITPKLEVTGSANVGALVGAAFEGTGGTMSECETVAAKVRATTTDTGDGYVGGMIGIGRGGIVEDCKVMQPDVQAVNYAAGGLVGGVPGWGVTFRNCQVDKPLIDDVSYAGGGFIGADSGARIEDCGVTDGVVQGLDNDSAAIGGFVGYRNAGETSGSYSSADVWAGSYVGGFAGENDNASITNSYSSGNVVAGSALGVAGGFVGFHNSSSAINNCYSTSNVTAIGPHVGGFAGSTRYGYALTNDCAYGLVSCDASQSGVGGFVGSASEGGNTSGCRYLLMNGYNEDVPETFGATKTKYSELVAPGWSEGSTSAVSFPKTGSLKQSGFPFVMVTPEHHGDWPLFVGDAINPVGGDWGRLISALVGTTGEDNTGLNNLYWTLIGKQSGIDEYAINGPSWYFKNKSTLVVESVSNDPETSAFVTSINAMLDADGRFPSNRFYWCIVAKSGTTLVSANSGQPIGKRAGYNSPEENYLLFAMDRNLGETGIFDGWVFDFSRGARGLNPYRKVRYELSGGRLVVDRTEVDRPTWQYSYYTVTGDWVDVPDA